MSAATLIRKVLWNMKHVGEQIITEFSSLLQWHLSAHTHDHTPPSSRRRLLQPDEFLHICVILIPPAPSVLHFYEFRVFVFTCFSLKNTTTPSFLKRTKVRDWSVHHYRDRHMESRSHRRSFTDHIYWLWSVTCRDVHILYAHIHMLMSVWLDLLMEPLSLKAICLAGYKVFQCEEFSQICGRWSLERWMFEKKSIEENFLFYFKWVYWGIRLRTEPPSLHYQPL